jgi:hypothetical protein
MLKLRKNIYFFFLNVQNSTPNDSISLAGFVAVTTPIMSKFTAGFLCC